MMSQDEIVQGIKGYDAQLRCRGYQFELGQTSAHKGRVVACSSGFHSIPADEHPLTVFSYYAPAGSRFTEVSSAGEISRDGAKIASAQITIGVELTLNDLITRAVRWVFDRSKPEGEAATGWQGAASATGEQGAASATGWQGAASATGWQGAASATGTRGAASATGEQGAASATGTRGAASATGTRGAASATGEQGAASATGEQGAASATGTRGAASSSGDFGVALAAGTEGRAKGADGNALFLVYRDNWTGEIRHAWAGVAGRGDIKANTWYTLDASGNPVAAD